MKSYPESITVPVFCEGKVLMKVRLIPENLTAEEFVEQGVKVLAQTVLEELCPTPTS